MKQLLLAAMVFAALWGCSPSTKAVMQKVSYETSRDEGHEGNAKILKGVINRSILEQDTAFKWFADNMKYGNVDAAAVAAFAKQKDKFSIVVFGGTWCHDTQNLLPTFYKLADKSGYPDNKITLIGVDRKKQTIRNLQTMFNITNVPTFIVLDNNGKEVGRVVEYGKTGAIDKELGEIVNSIQ